MEYIRLNNGVEMPQQGLGTFLIPHSEIERVIGEAYALGYRQFDTAWRYHNEVEIAKALRTHGIKREDVFITTKLNVDALYRNGYQYGMKRVFNLFRSQTIKGAIQESFDNLQTDYIDLFLVHYPWPMFLEMYEELTKFYHAGKIRAIGVSNMLQPHIEALQGVSDVVPAVNQIEISPLNAQKTLIKWCHDRGIAVEAMSTFSHFRSNAPRVEILENDTLKSIAKKHEKSVVQIVLRWLIQQQVMVIPKTWKSEYLRENISIWDFDLTEDEMSAIDTLDGGKFLNYNPYLAQRGLPRKLRQWEGFHDLNNYPEWYAAMSPLRRWWCNTMN